MSLFLIWVAGRVADPASHGSYLVLVGKVSESPSGRPAAWAIQLEGTACWNAVGRNSHQPRGSRFRMSRPVIRARFTIS